MLTYTTSSTPDFEQARRLRKLWGAVVLAALDDALAEHRSNGQGDKDIYSWACSGNGREVLDLAGIDPSERVAENLAAFVRRGKPTSVALAKIRMDEGDVAAELVPKAPVAKRPSGRPLPSRSVPIRRRGDYLTR